MELLLERLFESKPKVRIMRLFLRNPGKGFSLEEMLSLTGLTRREAEKELDKLKKLDFVRTRKGQVVISEVKTKGKAKKLRMVTKNVQMYEMNANFEFFRELRDLILRQVPESRHKLIDKIKKLGRVRLAIASGAFINSDNSRVDLLIVGENVNRRRLEQILQQWQANAGRELSYCLMTTEEFKYRIDMFDRFTRDILESSHDKLINSLNIA